MFLFLLFLTAGAAARAQNGNLMVADFEGGKVETVQGLALVPFTDEQLGGTSEARLTLSHPGADGSRGALQISFRITATSRRHSVECSRCSVLRAWRPISRHTRACASTPQ